MLSRAATPDHKKDKMNHELPAIQPAGKMLAISDNYFAEWGIDQWVYIKPIQVDGRRVFAIFAANGQRMGLAGDRNTAMASVIQEKFTPLSLH